MKYKFVFLTSLVLFSTSITSQAETNDCTLMKRAASEAQVLKGIPGYGESDDETLEVIRHLNRCAEAGKKYSEFLRIQILPNLQGKYLRRKLGRIAVGDILNRQLISEIDYPKQNESCLNCYVGEPEGIEFYAELLEQSVRLTTFFPHVADEISDLAEILCDSAI